MLFPALKITGIVLIKRLKPYSASAALVETRLRTMLDRVEVVCVFLRTQL
jgi:hypothetical protein